MCVAGASFPGDPDFCVTCSGGDVIMAGIRVTSQGGDFWGCHGCAMSHLRQRNPVTQSSPPSDSVQRVNSVQPPREGMAPMRQIRLMAATAAGFALAVG